MAKSTLLLRLRSGRETYLRHVEFERCYRPRLEMSLAERAIDLTERHQLPVLTTVFFLHPPAPRKLSYRQVVDGHVVFERPFHVVQLWKENPEALLRQGAGTAALVGLTRRCRLIHIERAARVIAASSRGSERDQLLGILRQLCSERFTAERLAGRIPSPSPSAGPKRAPRKRPARHNS